MEEWGPYKVGEWWVCRSVSTFHFPSTIWHARHADKPLLMISVIGTFLKNFLDFFFAFLYIYIYIYFGCERLAEALGILLPAGLAEGMAGHSSLGNASLSAMKLMQHSACTNLLALASTVKC